MSERLEHQANILDLLAFMVQWRRFIFVVTLIFAVLATVISFIVPPKYRSTALIRSVESGSDGGITALLGSKLTALGGMSGFMAGLGHVEGDLYISVLKSRWMSERLIEQFDLRRVYGMEKEPLEDVIKIVKARTRFELDPSGQSVMIYADDRDPKRAQAIADFLVREVDKRYQELRSHNATREREFIEARLNESKSELSKFEDSLAAFQQETGIINPEEQVRATIQAAALLEAQRLATQSEIELKDMILGSGSNEVMYLRMRLASIDSAMRVFVRRTPGENNGDVLLSLADTPEKGLVYLRLMRDIEIQQLLVGFLIQKYEQARIEEQRNTPTLLQIDPPKIPGVRIWPRRGLMVGITTLAAFILSVAIAAVLDFVTRASRDPGHPQHNRILAIRRGWKSN